MKDRKNLVRCAVGDVVRFEFTHISDNESRHVIGRILAVTERYTSSPLITYELLEGKQIAIIDRGKQYADQSFITEVIERFNGPWQPRGRFIESGPTWVEKTRGTMTGWPYEMVLDVLNGKYLDIPRPLSMETVWWMFQRDRPGVIREVHPGLFRVRRKAFERWVMNNWRRFIMTVTDCRQDAEREDAIEREMWEQDFYGLLGEDGFQLDPDMPTSPTGLIIDISGDS